MKKIGREKAGRETSVHHREWRYQKGSTSDKRENSRVRLHTLQLFSLSSSNMFLFSLGLLFFSTTS
jgi:hypothetical protein